MAPSRIYVQESFQCQEELRDPQQGTPVFPPRPGRVETHSGRTKHMVEILNDHQNLTYFQESQNLNCWKACWSLFLSRFDFLLIHRPRRHSTKLDTLASDRP